MIEIAQEEIGAAVGSGPGLARDFDPDHSVGIRTTPEQDPAGLAAVGGLAGERLDRGPGGRLDHDAPLIVLFRHPDHRSDTPSSGLADRASGPRRRARCRTARPYSAWAAGREGRGRLEDAGPESRVAPAASPRRSWLQADRRAPGRLVLPSSAGGESRSRSRGRVRLGFIPPLAASSARAQSRQPVQGDRIRRISPKAPSSRTHAKTAGLPARRMRWFAARRESTPSVLTTTRSTSGRTERTRSAS